MRENETYAAPIIKKEKKKNWIRMGHTEAEREEKRNWSVELAHRRGVFAICRYELTALLLLLMCRAQSNVHIFISSFPVRLSINVAWSFPAYLPFVAQLKRHIGITFRDEYRVSNHESCVWCKVQDALTLFTTVVEEEETEQEKHTHTRARSRSRLRTHETRIY